MNKFLFSFLSPEFEKLLIPGFLLAKSVNLEQISLFVTGMITLTISN